MCRRDTPFDFANDLFPLLLAADEPILGVPMDGYWCDIGTPRAYYRCCLDVLDGRLSPTPQEAPESPGRPPRNAQTRSGAVSPAATARTGCAPCRRR